MDTQIIHANTSHAQAPVTTTVDLYPVHPPKNDLGVYVGYVECAIQYQDGTWDDNAALHITPKGKIWVHTRRHVFQSLGWRRVGNGTLEVKGATPKYTGTDIWGEAEWQWRDLHVTVSEGAWRSAAFKALECMGVKRGELPPAPPPPVGLATSRRCEFGVG